MKNQINGCHPERRARDLGVGLTPERDSASLSRHNAPAQIPRSTLGMTPWRGWLFAIFAVLALALPATAAIQYEFTQTTRWDQENSRVFEVTGRAVLDGDRSRIDYTRNPVYGDGTFVITYLSSRSMYVVDPRKRTYYDINLATVANTLGSFKMEIANLKTNARVLDDHPLIAGVPTDHYRLDTSYEMTVLFGRIPLKQTVQTSIDSWTTTAFGSVPDPVFSGSEFRTGNPTLDQLIQAETSKIKGLALRQVVTITTTSKEGTRSVRGVNKLKLTKRQTSEALVTSIGTVSVEPTYFQIPQGFKKSAPEQQGIDGQPLRPEGAPKSR